MRNRLFIDVRCLSLCLLCSCSFKFELTSQRTALENQILGTYQELDEDLVMVASVSATERKAISNSSERLSGKEQVNKAKLSREFNRIDVLELKNEQILGETWDGRLVVLPNDVGLVEKASAAQLKLAQLVTYEENRDRQLIWQRTIAESDELDEQDFDEVRRTFVRRLQQEAIAGHWFLSEEGIWSQKNIEVAVE